MNRLLLLASSRQPSKARQAAVIDKHRCVTLLANTALSTRTTPQLTQLNTNRHYAFQVQGRARICEAQGRGRAYPRKVQRPHSSKHPLRSVYTRDGQAKSSSRSSARRLRSPRLPPSTRRSISSQPISPSASLSTSSASVSSSLQRRPYSFLSTRSCHQPPHSCPASTRSTRTRTASSILPIPARTPSVALRSCRCGYPHYTTLS